MESKIYECEDCGEHFAHKISLKIEHIENLHYTRTPKNFCDKGGKIFLGRII